MTTPTQTIPLALQNSLRGIASSARNAAAQLGVLARIDLDGLSGEADNRGWRVLLENIANELETSADYADQQSEAFEAQQERAQEAAAEAAQAATYTPTIAQRSAVLVFAAELVRGMMAELNAQAAEAEAQEAAA